MTQPEEADQQLAESEANTQHDSRKEDEDEEDITPLTEEQQRAFDQKIQAQYEKFTIKKREWEFVEDLGDAQHEERTNAASKTCMTLVNDLQRRVEEDVVEKYMSLKAFRLAKKGRASKREWIDLEREALGLNRSKEREELRKYRAAIRKYDKATKAPDTFKGRLDDAKYDLDNAVAKAQKQAHYRANMYDLTKTPIPYNLLKDDTTSSYIVHDSDMQHVMAAHRGHFFQPDVLAKKRTTRKDANALQLRNTVQKKDTLDGMPQSYISASWADLPYKAPPKEVNMVHVRNPPPICDFRALPAMGDPPPPTKKEQKKDQKKAALRKRYASLTAMHHVRKLKHSLLSASAPELVPLEPVVDADDDSTHSKLMKRAQMLKVELSHGLSTAAHGKPKYKPFKKRPENKDQDNAFDYHKLTTTRENIEHKMNDTKEKLVRLGIMPEDIQPAMLDDSDLSARSKQVRAMREFLKTTGDDIPASFWLQKREMPPWRGVDPLERARRQTLFDQLDSDHDGLLDRKELLSALQKMGIKVNQRELDRLWACISSSAERETVSFQEFTNDFHKSQELEVLYKIFGDRKKAAEKKEKGFGDRIQPVLPIRLWAPAFHRREVIDSVVKQYQDKEKLMRRLFAGGRRGGVTSAVLSGFGKGLLAKTLPKPQQTKLQGTNNLAETTVFKPKFLKPATLGKSVLGQLKLA